MVPGFNPARLFNWGALCGDKGSGQGARSRDKKTMIHHRVYMPLRNGR